MSAPLQAAPPAPSDAARWRGVAALNGVSTLAQLGQYGLGTTLLPLALQARGAGAGHIGLVSSLFWVGMLAGLLSAGRLTRRGGYRGAVVAGMAVSALAFLALPVLPPSAWGLPSALIGLGLGWRWIGNETWLYRLAPGAARGRIVGVHETLIALASVGGPLAVAALGTDGPQAFWLGAALCMAALPPLWLAPVLAANAPEAPPPAAVRTRRWALPLGAGLAGVGGWVEGSLLSQLGGVLAGLGRPVEEAAGLLTLLGAGGMLCQFPLGWLADHHGLRSAARLCTAALAAVTLAVLLVPPTPALLAVTVFVVGGAAAGLLTLGMVEAAQGEHAEDITTRVQQVSLVYTALSACGPALAGLLIERSGQPALLWALQGLLVAVLVGLLRGRPAAYTASS